MSGMPRSSKPGIHGGMGRPAAKSSVLLQATYPAFARNSAMIRSFQPPGGIASFVVVADGSDMTSLRCLEHRS
jgi:hypothetical protein